MPRDTMDRVTESVWPVDHRGTFVHPIKVFINTIGIHVFFGIHLGLNAFWRFFRRQKAYEKKNPYWDGFIYESRQ